MMLRCCILTLVLAAAVHPVFSREKNRAAPDSTVICTPDPARPERCYIINDTICILSDNNVRLYDSLHVKSRRRAVPRMLYDMIVVRPKLDTTINGMVIDESRLYEPFAGRTIGEITIERSDVFNPDGNWLERTGNKIHVLTRERVVRRDLLFKPGDKLDPQLLVRNKHLLRTRPYLSDAWVILVPDAEDSTRVDVIVRTRDSWTISAALDFGRDDRAMFKVYDANILGTGNRLSLTTNLNWKNFDYGGNIVSYELPNIFGTFYEGFFSAGRDFYNSELRFRLNKKFIRPTDYEVGIEYNDIKSKYYFVEHDTMEVRKVRSLDIWAGRSRYIPGIRSSIFLTGHYTHALFPIRPEVTATHNPAFHNFDRLLFGLGLYREKFYSANMVYGFGTREYLATGYNAEIIGGYSWEEFGERLYFGFGVRGGDFTPLGYMMGGFALGSFVDPETGTWSRSAVDIDLRWTSNLFIVRRSRVRQFLSINYTQGWNRGTGSDEILRFDKPNTLRTIRRSVTEGTNRMILNTETVIFTPFQPLGFRFAIFGFADFGTLGYEPNPFNNEFCASFGVGLRIKNERLIFSTIQIQVGFAVGKQGWLDSRYIDTSSETRMDPFRYIPTRPEVVGFK